MENRNNIWAKDIQTSFNLKQGDGPSPEIEDGIKIVYPLNVKLEVINTGSFSVADRKFRVLGGYLSARTIVSDTGTYWGFRIRKNLVYYDFIVPLVPSTTQVRTQSLNFTPNYIELNSGDYIQSIYDVLPAAYSFIVWGYYVE